MRTPHVKKTGPSRVEGTVPKTRAGLLQEIRVLQDRVAVLTRTEALKKRGESAIEEIVANLSPLRGEAFLELLVTQFSRVLRADYTLIGEFLPGEHNAIQTLALCAGGQIVDNIRYRLAGTPCANVIGKALCTYPAGVAQLFPQDTLLVEMGVEGYIGVPLLDSENQPLGLMVALYKKPITEEGLAQSVMRIFATSAATEIERKRTARAWMESEERFRQIVEASPMGIHMYRLDSEDRLVFTGANPAADHILAVDNHQFIGKTIEEAFPPLTDTEVPTRYREAAARGITWHTEQIQYHNNQISGAFEVYAFQTQPNAMAAMFLDITRRKQAEEDLRKLRNLLANIVNSMPSILIAVDAHGQVTQWNREAEKETGIPPDLAIGKHLEQVFPHLKQAMELVHQAIQSRMPQANTHLPLTINSRTHFVDVTVFPLITNGIEGAVLRVDDISERIQIEEMLIQSEKMLSVGGLAAGMAHEINNPLAGILQNAQVMLHRLTAKLPKNLQIATECGTQMPYIEEYLRRREIFIMLDSILASGQRAAKIVSNMLSFSRKSESQFTPGNITELLDRTIELASNDYDLKKKYDFRCIHIQKEYAPQIPSVLCENTKIQQVFLNILKNGAQAMSDKWNRKHPQNCDQKQPAEQIGAFQENPRFIIRVREEKNMVRIEIEDNGPGIDKAVQKRIFEPFFTTKEPGTGTGLGLSVSYFIITENHKGTLAVESTPGEGAKFIIHLPITQEESLPEKKDIIHDQSI